MKTFILFLALVIFTPSMFSQNQQQPTETQSWTILAAYTIPGKASGLAWDGEYVYSGLYSSPGDDNLIYKIDPQDGSYTLQCSGPMESAYGLTYNSSSGNFWTTDHPSANQPGIAIEFEPNGDYVSEFDLPATYFSGIAYDNGNYWATCYYNPDGEVYKLSSTGSVLGQFAAPGEQPWDICTQGNYLWIADYNDNKLYKVDHSGTLIESHDCENIKPSGIVFDGTYLWYVDGGLQVDSKLYKIDLNGSGNPDVNVPQPNHDYGVVTLNTTATWGCLVINNGGAALQVTYGEISGEGSQFIDWSEGTSFTIDANSSSTIYLNYTPTSVGLLDAVAVLETNDPVTPEVELTMTGIAVNPGPYIYLPYDSIDYGDVRAGAYTRWQLEVHNKGDEALTITDASVDDTLHYFMDERDTLPITLEPLESTKIGVWFNPDSGDDFPASISISSTDQTQNPLIVYATGSGLVQDWPIGEELWKYTIQSPIDASPKAMSGIQDITGDGVEDLIVCSEDNYVRCFNGNSHGTADVIWETQIYSGAVYQQNCLTTIPDIDEDGYEDLVVGTAWGDRSIVALSGYSGAQIWKHHTNEYGDGGWVYQVDATHDYNEDGFPDVLAATGDDSGDTGPKRVYCLDGKTGLSIWETPFNGPVFSVIGIEDFTGDGLPDAIAGASNESETEGSFYGIDGSDGNNKWNFVTQGSTVWALAQVDDVDNSGTADIIAGVNNGQYYIVDPKSLLRLVSSGIGSSTIVRFVVLDDINRDGYRDVLVASGSSRAIVVDGAAPGYLVDTPVADKSWVVDRIGDVSGDGINDIVLGTLYTNNYAYFVDTYTTEVMFDENYGQAVDAIKSINDITGDYSMEMVVGGRNGTIICYSGGLDATVGVEENTDQITGENSHQAYPNPFSISTTIAVKLAKEQQLTITIFDQNGKKIETLSDSKVQAGNHEFIWEPADFLNNGIYFYNISTSKTVETGKLVLLR